MVGSFSMRIMSNLLRLIFMVQNYLVFLRCQFSHIPKSRALFPIVRLRPRKISVNVSDPYVEFNGSVRSKVLHFRKFVSHFLYKIKFFLRIFVGALLELFTTCAGNANRCRGTNTRYIHTVNARYNVR